MTWSSRSCIVLCEGGNVNKENVNVHEVERLVSSVLGGALVSWGITRRSLGGVVMGIAGGVLLYRGISGHSYLYQGLGMNTTDRSRQLGARATAGAPEIEHSITVEKPARELYRFWREPQQFAQIMEDFAEVTPLDENRTHWRVRSPFGRTLEWDTQVVEDRPGEMLRWESLQGARLRSEGEVRFRPAPKDWGTETTLHLRFDTPGGVIGKTLAPRQGIMSHMPVEKALRRFKSLAETGEIPTPEPNPTSRPRGFAQ